jgi:hypothetical protein
MVVIGVTGHRFLVNVNKIEAGVAKALDRILEAFPSDSIRVVSGLAEGADRMVVHQVLSRPNGRLKAVLPLPKSDYDTDFQNAESIQEFTSLLGRAEEVLELDTACTREEAYEAVGRYVLDHCDVMLALWDGRDAQGRGGTGEIVSEARKRGLPIAWVHVGNRKAGTNEPTTLREGQGKVSFERFPHREAPRKAREAHE